MNQLNLSKFKYLLFLMPFALMTGPLVPEIIVLFIIGYLLTITILEKKIHIYNNNFFKFFIIICFYVLIRNYFSDYFFKNQHISLFYFRFTVFALGYIF